MILKKGRRLQWVQIHSSSDPIVSSSRTRLLGHHNLHDTTNNMLLLQEKDVLCPLWRLGRGEHRWPPFDQIDQWCGNEGEKSTTAAEGVAYREHHWWWAPFQSMIFPALRNSSALHPPPWWCREMRTCGGPSSRLGDSWDGVSGVISADSSRLHATNPNLHAIAVLPKWHNTTCL